MLTSKQKIKYLFDSLVASGQRKQCPYCKSKNCREIDRKYLVTRLMECQVCHLYFRYPVDKMEINSDFYQEEYQETDNITTDLPDAITLGKMKLDGFSTAGKNGNRYINLFKKLFPSENSLRIIDYGSSWGYLTYQFKEDGHRVQAFEISRARAAYGRQNLGVDIQTEEKTLKPGNHIFFSSHVIEHHPDISAMIHLAKALLIDGGYFIAFCPNGSTAYRLKNPDAFHHSWGKVHPNFLNSAFYKYVFKDNPHYIGTSPVNLEKIHPLERDEFIVDDLSGEELFVIVKIGNDA
jgi:2-polyprenyl-3-methyl-5-hydroxy-6-metoxy-1,4-benzoquinol methylase